MSLSPLLRTDKISKTYDLGQIKIHAVKEVSLTVNKGEFSSIIGKSGSGKSTLMHMIGLLDTPTSGQIYLNGNEVSTLSEEKLAKIRNKEIGFVFQAYNLLARTSALENVILPLKYSDVPKSQWKEKAESMLKLVGLGDRMNNKSNELSGGQKQRVAIARALVNDPSIILADEPTGNLDTKTTDEIIELFRGLSQKGKTIVIVTHDDDISNVTNRKITITDGSIVSDEYINGN